MALLGANGAGKSTTLGAVLSLYRPAGGTILYRGQPVSGRETADNVADGIALVPEGRRLFPGHDGAGESADGRLCARQAARRRRWAGSLLRLVSRAERKGRASLRASFRVVSSRWSPIGRALMSRPRLLLLDEPFLGVAPIIIEEVMAALQRLSQDGVTMLLVEQNIRRAMDFVARAYVIENGRTVLEGTRELLLGDPNFSNKFLGLD